MLRIYVSNTDVVKGESVYEKIVRDAKHFGLMGATTYKAVMGYGLSSNLSFNKFWEMNSKVPIADIVRLWMKRIKLGHFLTKRKCGLNRCLKVALLHFRMWRYFFRKKERNKKACQTNGTPS